MEHNIQSFNKYLQSFDLKIEVDLKLVERQKKILLIDNKTKSIELVEEFENLETLYLINVNFEIFSIIHKVKSLKNLKLTYLKSENLLEFYKPNNIENLVIEDSTKLANLSGIENFQNLKMLSVGNSKNLNDLRGVEKLKSLKTFDISGGDLNIVKIKSLEPLSKILTLELIQLVTVKIIDERLDWLENLINLKKLFTPNNFPMEQYAKLSFKLKNTECIYFEPYVIIDKDTVMITGKNKPFLNIKKEKSKINKYVEQYEIAKKFIA